MYIVNQGKRIFQFAFDEDKYPTPLPFFLGKIKE
jgi:hypothetical protein